MRLSAFRPSRDAFARAVASGQLRETAPIVVAPIGNGIPAWPALALGHVLERAPTAQELADQVTAATERLVPLVRAGGLFLTTTGVVAGTFSPVAALIGKLAGPSLASAAGAVGSLATPAVGAAAAAAVGAAAGAAGPIVATGAAVAAASGAVVGGAPDPEALRNLGRQMETQITDLTNKVGQDNKPVTMPVTDVEV